MPGRGLKHGTCYYIGLEWITQRAKLHIQNQLTESLMLFKSLLSIQSLKTLSVVLILNKLDVFKQQIQEHPLKIWFPDFVGRERDQEAALLYIMARFREAKSHYDEREIDIRYTDATDMEACQATFRDIEDSVMPKRSESHKGRRQTFSLNVSDLKNLRPVIG